MDTLLRKLRPRQRSTTWPLEGLLIEPEVSPSPATKAETETPPPSKCCLVVIEEETGDGKHSSDGTFSIPANSRICNQDNLFLGPVPKYLVLGMVHHKGFTGKRNLSPSNFIHNNVEYLSLCQDSRQIPAKAFQPHFGQGILVREFYNMFI
ncbi:hypothetical protein L3Q82_024183 [Scortum barcoo]|uniref:Uncharacterized protein n=1 Tax=Scortum barcoo TaxID=214431 RepID=A0ACB8WY37_9TELE|nr:hypothetical protein L3Q82_024183 [Scortum barcoo]